MRGMIRALVWIAVAISATAGVGWTYEQIAEARDARLYPAPGRLVDVGGRRLHLRCEGSSPGSTVVMLAGGGTPAVASYVLQDKIAAFAKVCSYDRPGLGWSDPAPAPMSLDDHVADLDRLLKVGGVSGPVVLAPESFGALIAIRFAQTHPGKVSAIVFIDGAEPVTWFATIRKEGWWPSRLKEAMIKVGWPLGIVRLVLPRVQPPFAATLAQPVRGEFRSVFSRTNPGWGDALDVYEHTPPNARPSSAPGSLGAIPVVVISHGQSSDLVSPAFEAVWSEAQARLARLPTTPATVMAVESGGHMIAQEEPDLVANAIRDSLRRSSVGSAAVAAGRPHRWLPVATSSSRETALLNRSQRLLASARTPAFISSIVFAGPS